MSYMVKDSNPYFLPKDVTQEVCPHCEYIGEYKDDGSHVVICDGCGKKILLCSLCDLNGCSGCDVEHSHFNKFKEFYD